MASIPDYPDSSVKIISKRTDALSMVSVNKQYDKTIFVKFYKIILVVTLLLFYIPVLRMSHMPGKTVTGEEQVFFASHVFHQLIPAIITKATHLIQTTFGHIRRNSMGLWLKKGCETRQTWVPIVMAPPLTSLFKPQFYYLQKVENTSFFRRLLLTIKSDNM